GDSRRSESDGTRMSEAVAPPLPATVAIEHANEHDPMHDGNPASRILIVAQSPRSEEMVIGRPLVGASGRLLCRTLGLEGITREQCYIVNTIGELPEGRSKTGRAEVITPAQATRWREKFYE